VLHHDDSVNIEHDADMARAALLAGRSHDPLGFLGAHREGDAWVYRARLPHAAQAWLVGARDAKPLRRDGATDLFVRRLDATPPRPWRLRVREGQAVRDFFDPYGFAPTISEFELHLFNAGQLLEAYRTLGANGMTIDGVDGVRFAVWAPNAERVSLVGDFNRWDGRAHPMQSRGASGLWELFVPGMAAGSLYKFEIRNRASGRVFVKTDPYARAFERRPGTAARVEAPSSHAWLDAAWL
jgi:1,4-alpha-glucan branching enzyme